MIFFLVSQRSGFDISCKLSPLETICIRYQILYPVKNNKKKKKKSKCRLMKILPRCLVLICIIKNELYEKASEAICCNKKGKKVLLKEKVLFGGQ